MNQNSQSVLRRNVETVIFGTSTPAGRAFDIGLLLAIIFSVGAVILDSIISVNAQYGALLQNIELVFTMLFTIEYVTRIWCVQQRRAYILSFWGVVDLLSILPTYIALIVPEAAPLLIIRLLRVMRIFRVMRMFELMNEFHEIINVLRSTGRAILVFFALVFIVVIIFACLLYVVEGPEHGFTSIPLSIYWAVVTITTVGYGDLIPQTGLGKAIASLGMLLGYSIIAVPTAIITSKLWERLNRRREQTINWNCPVCARPGHTEDADYCKYCGSALDVPAELRKTVEPLDK